jgi:iron complex transport system substrate-binding protein
VPTSLAETVAQLLGHRPRILSLDAHRVADVFAGVEAVAAAAGQPERGARRAAELRGRVAAVSGRVRGRARPRVLAIEWLDPPFVPGHWTPEMITLAGGDCLVGDVGRPSRAVSWSDLAGLDPDVLVVMPCGYGLTQSLDDAARFADRLQEVAPRAAEQGRAFVVDGSAYFNRSGPRMVDGVEILGALLHPALFPETDLAGKAQARPASAGSPA